MGLVITAEYRERAGAVVLDFQGGDVARKKELARRSGVGNGGDPRLGTDTRPRF